MKNWSFSLLLAVVYLVVFAFWNIADPEWVVTSSTGATALLLAGFVAAAQRRYFFNRIDAFLHAVVIFDVLLEGLFTKFHSSQGFIWCALEFAVVVGGYRYFCVRRAATRGRRASR